MLSPRFVLIGVCCIPALAAQGPEGQKAEAEFQRAEKAVADAKYGAAVQLYKQLAARYPNTAWGKMAALRTQPTAYLGWGDLQRHGASNNRVDVVMMGDGFALDDQNEFEDLTSVPGGSELGDAAPGTWPNRVARSACSGSAW